MSKLLIVASMLGRDGTSRFITYLTNSLSTQGKIEVQLLFFRKVEKEFLERISESVKVKSLGIENKLWMSFPKIIINIIKARPNYCLFGFHQLLWMSFLSPLMHVFGIKLFFRDTIIPSLFHQGESQWKVRVSKKAYQLFDRIIVQSIDMRDDLVNNWGCSPLKMVLVNNPVDVAEIKERIGSCPDELKEKKVFTFVAAGRLTYQKGYDIIIERMVEMKPNIPFQLYVLGSGEQAALLDNLVKEKGLEDSVIFLGYKRNVPTYLKYADALMLSSRYEGFPNIVLEANALGVPVFSNTCLGGINEIVVDNVNGITCNFEDSIDFQKCLKRFMDCKFDRETIEGLTRDKYDISVIMTKYNTIFS